MKTMWLSAVATVVGLTTMTFLPGVRSEDFCDLALEPLLPAFVLDIDAPQGIARDAEGNYWISSALSLDVLKLNAKLEPLLEESFTADIPLVTNPFGNQFSGIAYNPDNDTLFLCRSFTKEIWEVRKDGSSTGYLLVLDLPKPPNIIPEPFPKGIAFDPAGDGGQGSFWVVEAVLSAIYEVSMSGEILRSFCHPDDPDGCPGNGTAAKTNDVGFFHDGGSVRLEITGGVVRRELLHRVDLDGTPTGVSYFLGEIGGVPGGFLRDTMLSPDTGEEVDVFLVTVESSSELYVLRIEEPAVRPLLDLQCELFADAVEIQWTNTDGYDAIEVWREGIRLAVLEGDRNSFTDSAPPNGIVDYEIRAVKGDDESAVNCSLTVGTGQIIRHVIFEGLQIVDITEDSEENLWVTHASNELGVFNKNLERHFFFPGPFQQDGDVMSGIAFNPDSSLEDPTFFVYNATTNIVAETDGGGQLVGAPFPSGVPSTLDDPAIVPCMLYNSAGGNGEGSFWYLDYTSGTIQERTRDGTLLFSCFHPDHLAEPPPPMARLKTYAWGLSTIPGHGFDLLELSGGRVRDGGTTRILRVSTADCEPTGAEIPVGALAKFRRPIVLSLLRTSHDGHPVLYIIDSDSRPQTRFYEVDASPPPVPVVAELHCVQASPEPDVKLSFLVDGNLDAVEILRDGSPLVTLDGTTRVWTDSTVPPGRRTYTVHGRVADVIGDDRECSLQVGPGSIAARQFADPVSLLHQLAFDPVENLLVAASKNNRYADTLHLYDMNLTYFGPVDCGFTSPWQVAALCVRVDGDASEYYCLGWQPGSPPNPGDADPTLPVHVSDVTGQILREFTVSVPAPHEPLVIFPNGMGWDEGSDTLWILGRNSQTIINVDLDGNLLSSFPHPEPVLQDDVDDFGLAVDGLRGALYLPGAGPFDHRVSRLVEVTRSGQFTGFEIPVGGDGYNTIRGFTLDGSGRNFIVSARSSTALVSDLVRYRVFGEVERVRFPDCQRVGGDAGTHRDHELTWTNGETYDSITVYRNQAVAAELDGSPTSWRDTDGGTTCGLFYRIVGRLGNQDSAGTICEAPPAPSFIRGDVEEDGEIIIGDAISILGFLFLGTTRPPCLDAADVDDDGKVAINDPVLILGFLFLDGVPPTAPHPEPGCDPTGDTLACTR